MYFAILKMMTTETICENNSFEVIVVQGMPYVRKHISLL